MGEKTKHEQTLLISLIFTGWQQKHILWTAVFTQVKFHFQNIIVYYWAGGLHSGLYHTFLVITFVLIMTCLLRRRHTELCAYSIVVGAKGLFDFV